MIEAVPGAARRDADEAATVIEDEFGAKDYRNEMKLRPDHESRPIWIVSKKAEKFLNSV